MYRINAISHRGVRFRFRLQGDSVHDIRDLIDTLLAGQNIRLVVVEALS